MKLIPKRTFRIERISYPPGVPFDVPEEYEHLADDFRNFTAVKEPKLEKKIEQAIPEQELKSKPKTKKRSKKRSKKKSKKKPKKGGKK